MSVAESARQEMMSVLAHSKSHELEALWDEWSFKPSYELLRGPETGLVMVRGRVGGGGSPFNFGEVTVTRATVRIEAGQIGHAYSLGGDAEKVTLAALVDALWQVPSLQDDIVKLIIEPLRKLKLLADIKAAEEASATKVNFFTMVRGDD